MAKARNTRINDRDEDGLMEQLRSSLDEVEKLLGDAAHAGEDKAGELREKAMDALRNTRLALHDTQDAVIARSRRAARVTDEYVHDNPWQAIGLSAVAGLLLGVLISRR
ncbi:DUF883 family protein [Pusillimonas sp. CC-YST705]|uniref:DUF883 family protein n=1 Tax=Mesopusillimonas faecipullorum TaxID=2755040 RepID=A0ABS8CGC7_9BURK|nr:DUF883 family protein [Mesopusillimonas faecipullorum]MCB5364599.1 DUF883 family protein [Mesopusillimonas faecipullorum]